MDSDLFSPVLQRTMKTWKTYVLAICVLHLTLTIDMLSGSSFLTGKSDINLAGFKVVREALSATYGVLFTVFVATVFLESQLLKARSAASELSGYDRRPVLDLWFISPFSDSRILRTVFWFLFFDGFILLSVFTFAHLAVLSPPDPKRMSLTLYVGIGAIDGLLMILCAPFAYQTYHNLEQVRTALAKK